MTNFKRVFFKNNKVWAKVDEANNIVVKNNCAEIRYKLTDSRTYTAAMANIKQIEGERAVESELQDTKPVKKTGSKKKEDTSGLSNIKTGLTGEVIEAWTDGACSGNPGEAGSGIVLLFGQHRLEIAHYLGKATNNIAELEAINIALKKVKDKSKSMRIYTDSSYSLGVLTKGWKAKKNPELVEEIKNRISEFKEIEFVKVKGHVGIEENEKADELARLAIQDKKSSENRF